MKCDVCGKSALTQNGFHLKAGKVDLDFCGNKCIAEYVEKTMTIYLKTLNQQDKRIAKLEKRIKRG